MKFIVLILFSILSFSSIAQETILDFYAKDLKFCEKYLTQSNDYTSKDGTVFYKKFDGIKVYFIYSSTFKRVSSIYIPYTSKSEVSVYNKYFNSFSKGKYKKYWILRSAKDNFLMLIYNDKKEHMFIIF